MNLKAVSALSKKIFEKGGIIIKVCVPKIRSRLNFIKVCVPKIGFGLKLTLLIKFKRGGNNKKGGIIKKFVCLKSGLALT